MHDFARHGDTAPNGPAVPGRPRPSTRQPAIRNTVPRGALFKRAGAVPMFQRDGRMKE